MARQSKYRIGVISDTHGLLRPDVFRIFKGIDMILHAGDVGSVDILRALEKIAPVTAVYGNMDNGPLNQLLSKAESLTVGDKNVYLIHDLFQIDSDPEVTNVQVIISGHTHWPEIRKEGNVFYLNPGSAGPIRPRKPVTVAILTIEGQTISATHIELET